MAERGFWTYLGALLNSKEVKTDHPSEHPTVSSGDYIVKVTTDMASTHLLILDPSKIDYIKTMLLPSLNQDSNLKRILEFD